MPDPVFGCMPDPQSELAASCEAILQQCLAFSYLVLSHLLAQTRQRTEMWNSAYYCCLHLYLRAPQYKVVPRLHLTENVEILLNLSIIYLLWISANAQVTKSPLVYG